MNNDFTVSLRIYSEHLDIEGTTLILGLTPTNTWKKNDRAPGNKIFEESMWEYWEKSELGGLKDWETLEDGIKSLLTVISPLKVELEKFRASSRIVLYCGMFHDFPWASFQLSASALKLIGELRLELDLSTYGPFEEDQVTAA